MVKGRLAWIDIAKGFAILGVVIGHILDHVLRSVGGYELPVEGYVGMYYFDHFLYTFHVPLFFLLSGFLFSKSAAIFSTAMHKALFTFRLYLIWSVMIVLAKVLFSQFVSNPMALVEVLTFFYKPVGVTWFLYCLSVFMLFEAMGYRIFKGKQIAVAFMLYVLFSCFSFFGIEEGLFEFPKRIMKYYIFFSLGVWLNNHLEFLMYNKQRFVFYAVFGLLNFMLYEYFHQDVKIFYLIASVCFIMVIIFKVQKISGVVHDILAGIGKYSLQIYLLHIFIVYALMSLFHIQTLWFILVVITMGVLLPVGLALLMPKQARKVFFGK